jgi:hypothetical protein
MTRLRFLVAFAGLGLAALSLPADRATQAAENQAVDPAAVERARKTVRMLDDVYKTTVVLITDKYVNNKKDYPAGRAAKKLFGEISKRGSHEVRLIDATGEPYDARNVARMISTRKASRGSRPARPAMSRWSRGAASPTSAP